MIWNLNYIKERVSVRIQYSFIILVDCPFFDEINNLWIKDISENNVLEFSQIILK